MLSSSNNKEGYKNQSGTALNYEGLSSVEDYSPIPISIDAASRDTSNPDSTMNLRPYLAMGFDTSTGRYKPFNSAVHQSETVVVLMEEVRNLDTVTSYTNAVAAFMGTFKSGIIIVPTGQTVTWTDVQRIKRRDNI